jgi:hypothetical protein
MSMQCMQWNIATSKKVATMSAGPWIVIYNIKRLGLGLLLHIPIPFANGLIDELFIVAWAHSLENISSSRKEYFIYLLGSR